MYTIKDIEDGKVCLVVYPSDNFDNSKINFMKFISNGICHHFNSDEVEISKCSIKSNIPFITLEQFNNNI